MTKLDKYVSIEFLLAFLLIIAYFLPWVDMALFVKVVGWDIPQVQNELAKMTNEFVEDPSNTYLLNAIFVIPFLSFISLIFSTLLKYKISRMLLFIASTLGIALSCYLFITLPHTSSGVYMLCVTSLITITYTSLIYLNRNKENK